MLKRLTVLLFCVILSISLFSCITTSSPESNSPELKEDSSSTSEKSMEEKTKRSVGDYVFGKVENTTDVEFVWEKDGYGRCAFPRPKNSEVHKDASNRVQITGDDYTIFIEYLGQIPSEYSDNFGNEPSEAALVSCFEPQLATQEFLHEGRYYHRQGEAASRIDGGLDRIDDVRGIRIFRRWEKVNAARKSVEFRRDFASEYRYYLAFGDMWACFSMICPQTDSAKYGAILDYMVGNLRNYDEDVFPSSQKVSVGDGDVTVSLSSLFQNVGTKPVEYAGASGTMYVVPEDSGSSVSGAFFYAARTSDSYEIGEKSINSSYVFLDAFPSMEGKIQLNDVPNQMPGDAEPFSPICAVREKMKKKGYEGSAIFESYYTVFRTQSGGSALVQTGSSWLIDQFTAKKDGKVYLIVIGIPTTRIDHGQKVLRV